MPSSLTLILFLGLVFVLLSQLHVLTLLRDIRGALRDILSDVNTRKKSEAVASFETFTSHEFRSNYRAKVDLAVNVFVLGRELPATVIDLSASGILLSFGEKMAFQLGEMFPMQIEFPTKEKVETRFKVVRIVGESEFGGCFDGISVKDRQIIKKFIQKEARRRLAEDFSERK